MFFNGLYSGIKYIFSPTLDDSTCTLSSSSTFFLSQLTPCDESVLLGTIVGDQSLQKSMLDTIQCGSVDTRVQLRFEEVLDKYIEIISNDKCDPTDLPDLYTESSELSDFLNSTTNPLRVSRAIKIFEESMRRVPLRSETLKKRRKKIYRKKEIENS